MGCVKSKKTIKIKTVESIKDQVLEQQKLISTYVSSSQCNESKSSSNSLPINDKTVKKDNNNNNKSDVNHNTIISEKDEKSLSESSSEKKS
jgi:hypothetical protein